MSFTAGNLLAFRCPAVAALGDRRAERLRLARRRREQLDRGRRPDGASLALGPWTPSAWRGRSSARAVVIGLLISPCDPDSEHRRGRGLLLVEIAAGRDYLGIIVAHTGGLTLRSIPCGDLGGLDANLLRRRLSPRRRRSRHSATSSCDIFPGVAAAGVRLCDSSPRSCRAVHCRAGAAHPPRQIFRGVREMSARPSRAGGRTPDRELGRPHRHAGLRARVPGSGRPRVAAETARRRESSPRAGGIRSKGIGAGEGFATTTSATQPGALTMS